MKILLAGVAAITILTVLIFLEIIETLREQINELDRNMIILKLDIKKLKNNE